MTTKQIKFKYLYDNSIQCGILIIQGDEQYIICGCCGGVFEVNEDIEILQIYDEWIDISNSIYRWWMKGDKNEYLFNQIKNRLTHQTSLNNGMHERWRMLYVMDSCSSRWTNKRRLRRHRQRWQILPWSSHNVSFTFWNIQRLWVKEPNMVLFFFFF